MEGLYVVILLVAVLFQLLMYIVKKTKMSEEQRKGRKPGEKAKPSAWQQVREYLEELEKQTMPQQQAPPPPAEPPVPPAQPTQPPRQQAPARSQPAPVPPPQRPAPQPARAPVRSGEPAPHPSGESLATVDERHLDTTTKADAREFAETVVENLGPKDVSTLHYELDEHLEAPGVRAGSSSQVRRRLQRILRRKSIRDAIMLREILDPPIALRGQDSER